MSLNKDIEELLKDFEQLRRAGVIHPLDASKFVIKAAALLKRCQQAESEFLARALKVIEKVERRRHGINYGDEVDRHKTLHALRKEFNQGEEG